MTTPLNIENFKINDIGKQITSFWGSINKKTWSHTIIMTRQQAIISVAIGIISIVALIVYGWIVYRDYEVLNAQAPQLSDLEHYTHPKIDDIVKDYAHGDSLDSIYGLLAVNTKIAETLQERNDILKNLIRYYDLFLRNLYLPSLNVWKNPYSKQIDITILGKRYLEEDLFQDILLIQYWSDFLKDIGVGHEFNQIDAISLGDITIEPNNPDYFSIPIQVTFSSPSKHSFLLMVDKLSSTSNSNNITLLNEFFFYLINNIRDYKSDILSDLKSRYAPILGEDVDLDDVIGYHLYQWIKKGGENRLIDEALIEITVQDNVRCDEKRQQSECFYAFREKYRNIPQLAYTIGVSEKEDKVQSLLNFFKDFPPIIAIESFSFSKSTTKSLQDPSYPYQGSVGFKAYGRNISNAEVDEIAIALGNLCKSNDGSSDFSVEVALERVANSMSVLNESDTLSPTLQSSTIINNLEELQTSFTTIQREYPGLSNYQKAIKLFETFRMLKDANLCK